MTRENRKVGDLLVKALRWVMRHVLAFAVIVLILAVGGKLWEQIRYYCETLPGNIDALTAGQSSLIEDGQKFERDVLSRMTRLWNHPASEDAVRIMRADIERLEREIGEAGAKIRTCS
jgi:predicted PurR-regulated permease PerM